MMLDPPFGVPDVIRPYGGNRTEYRSSEIGPHAESTKSQPPSACARTEAWHQNVEPRVPFPPVAVRMKSGNAAGKTTANMAFLAEPDHRSSPTSVRRCSPQKSKTRRGHARYRNQRPRRSDADLTQEHSVQ